MRNQIRTVADVALALADDSTEQTFSREMIIEMGRLLGVSPELDTRRSGGSFSRDEARRLLKSGICTR